MKFGKITGAMALTLAVAAVPAMAFNSRATRTNQSQNQQNGGMFSRLDRNSDGVVTRAEWTRDAATFNRLDLNRDGAITRSEAQQMMDSRRDGSVKGNSNGGQHRFRGMDTNGDGVITRDEWRGNDQSFRNHDRNGDNRLSGDELRGNGNGTADSQWKQKNAKDHSNGKKGERD